MRMVKEQENKFEVDADWVMPPVADLVPDGGRLDQEVRKLDNSYFDTPVLVYGCLGSPCGVGWVAQRRVGS